MYNDLLTIGNVTIHGYGLMIAIGIIVAYFTAEYRAKKKGLDSSRVFGFVICCALCGFLGAKILYILTVLPDIIQDPSYFLQTIGSGWVIYGGIIGGIIGAAIYTKRRKLPLWDFFDLALPSVALGQGFGRFGCFLAGCCYGVETTGPLAITFTHSDFAPNGVALVPTQLFSSVFDILLFFFLCVYDKRWKKGSGQVTAMYLMVYGVGRFIIEFFRGDLIRGQVGVLSTSQFISIFIIAAGVIIFIRRRKAKPLVVTEEKVEETAGEKTEESSDEKSEDSENKESEESVVESDDNATETQKEATEDNSDKSSKELRFASKEQWEGIK